MCNVEYAQRRKLLTILDENKETNFGVRNKFSEIKNYEDYVLNVPICAYSDYVDDVRLITMGKRNILTVKPVLRLIPSSGSSSSSKYIPYTKGLKHEFQKGLKPWIVDLFTKRRKLLNGKAYWAISPSVKFEDTRDANIPIGFDEDSGYFGPFAQKLIKRLLIVPEEVNLITNIDASRYVTLLFLLKEKNLRFISIWNPTFLSLLLTPLDKWIWSLISDIENGTITPPNVIEKSVEEKIANKHKLNPTRAYELKKIFCQKNRDNFKTMYEKIWPYLCVISCWADGPSKGYVAEIKKYFPSVEIQPKGLLATEGCVSFPLIGASGSILSVNSHFFEFIEVDNERNVKLAHQLEKNKLYSVIITTSGGLYRYRLGDIIKVIGLKANCPIIRFIGKEDNFSDLFGEKLNEYHVHTLLKSIFYKRNLSSRFFMMAPEVSADKLKHYYTLFIDGKGLSYEKLRDAEKDVEDALCENFNYKYCRKLGQLLPLKIFIIKDMEWNDYYRVRSINDAKTSVSKLSILSSKVGWSKKLSGDFLGT